MRSGSLLRGEVLARWHEVIGTGDVMRALESRVGWVRDRVKSVLTGKPAADEELRVAVENRIEAVIRAAAERASERAARAWREHTPGRALLSDSTTFDRASRELEARTEDEVSAWQGFVFELVSKEGESKRTTARLASLGVNGAGLTVMLAVFVHTGGLTGRRGRRRGWHLGDRSEGARGDLRRPGGEDARSPRARGSARAGRAAAAGRLSAFRRVARRDCVGRRERREAARVARRSPTRCVSRPARQAPGRTRRGREPGRGTAGRRSRSPAQTPSWRRPARDSASGSRTRSSRSQARPASGSRSCSTRCRAPSSRRSAVVGRRRR